MERRNTLATAALRRFATSWRRLGHALLCACLLLTPQLALAASALAPVNVDRNLDKQDLTASTEYLVDASGQVSASTPWSGDPLWLRLDGPLRFNRMADGEPTLWLRIAVQVPPGESFDRMVVIDSRHVQRVQMLWEGQESMPSVLAESGLRLMAQGRVEPRAAPALVWRVPPGASGHLYLKLTTRVSPWGGIHLWEPAAHERAVAARNLGLGIYFGVLAGLMLFNILLWRVLRDRARLLYLLSCLSLIGFQAATSGLGLVVIWPALAHLNPLFIAVSGCLMGVTGLLFVVSFFDIDEGSPRASLAMKLLAALWLLAPLLLAHPDAMPWFERLVPLLSGLTLVALITAAVLGLRWRRAGAVYFAVAWSLYGVAILLRILMRVQLLPQVGWLYDAFYWVSALEMALLAQALAVKVREANKAHRELQIRRERDQALKAAAEQAVVDKSRFLAAVAHDIQQPVYAIGLATEVLSRQRLPETSQAALAQIRAAVGSADEILAALTLVVQLDADSLRPDVRAVSVQDALDRIEALFAPMAQEKGLQWRVTPCIERVLTDPALLERMLGNIVSNALRYTARGGVLLSCRKRRAGLLIQVWDTGPGIAHSEQSLIFQEHARGQAARAGDGGLGLGLDIVQRCAAQLNIGLTFRSIPGKGTCFGLLVPLADRAA